MRKGISVRAEIPLDFENLTTEVDNSVMHRKGTKFFDTRKSFPFTFLTEPTIYRETHYHYNHQGELGVQYIPQNIKGL